MKTTIEAGAFAAEISSKRLHIGIDHPDTSLGVEVIQEVLYVPIRKAGSAHLSSPFTTVVRLQFSKSDSLCVSKFGTGLTTSGRVQYDSYVNPYTNSVHDGMPELCLSEDFFHDDRYEITTFSDFLGDFIFMRESWPHGPDGQHVIGINLSALGLFEGLSSVDENGQTRVGENYIGTMAPKWIDMIRRSKRVKPDDVVQTTWDWRQRSYEISRRLLDPYAINSQNTVFGFSEIEYNRYPNKPNVSRQEGLKEAKALFERLLR